LDIDLLFKKEVSRITKALLMRLEAATKLTNGWKAKNRDLKTPQEQARISSLSPNHMAYSKPDTTYYFSSVLLVTVCEKAFSSVPEYAMWAKRTNY
jgi:hypothetical protein